SSYSVCLLRLRLRLPFRQLVCVLLRLVHAFFRLPIRYFEFNFARIFFAKTRYMSAIITRIYFEDFGATLRTIAPVVYLACFESVEVFTNHFLPPLARTSALLQSPLRMI